MSKTLLSATAMLSLLGVTTAYAQRVEVRAGDAQAPRVEVRAGQEPIAPAAPRAEVRAGQEPAAARAEVRTADQAGQAYRAKEVLGSKVSIEGNVSIGTVDDIVIDGDGYVEYLIVANDGKLVTVPWDAAKFNFKERSAMVSITADQFKQVPTYTTNQYPVFSAPAYRTDMYRFYGLTPRERRIERRIDRRN
jgi:hypothetical protein